MGSSVWRDPVFVLIALCFAYFGVAQEKSVESALDGKALIAAAQRGDVAKVKQTLDAGVDVDSLSDYGATALFFACDRGNAELVKLLLDRGADPNITDTFYKATPVTWAQNKGDQEILMMLFAAGGDGVSGYLLGRIFDGDVETIEKLLADNKLGQDDLLTAQAVAHAWESDQREAVIACFEKIDLPKFTPLDAADESTAKRFEGKYQTGRFSLKVEKKDGLLNAGFGDDANREMKPLVDNRFLFGRYLLEFEREPDQNASSVTMTAGTRKMTAWRLDLNAAKKGSQAEAPAEIADAGEGETDKDDVAVGEPASLANFQSSDLEVSSVHWPGFRGTGSRGIGDGQNAPTTWNVPKEDESEPANGLAWKTPVEGLGMSCPSIWGNRLFITSAVADGDQNVKIGLYGDVASVDDDREYEFRVLCLDKNSGSVLWSQVAHRGKPAVKRHAKSSHANPTVATNGNRVVAFFGTEGLYCYDIEGNLKWKRDFGLLDSGWFYDPGYQWGFGSSPLIVDDRVLVQCDIQGQSFLAALDLENGETIWQTDREEIPTWSSPIVHQFGDTKMVITNGTKSARGYDLMDGRELWSLKGHSEIVVPTPSVAHNLIFVASGYSPIQPIYAIKPNARGDVSLEASQTDNDFIRWSVKRGGPYMPSPIVYGRYLYCCANNGIFSCYDAVSGEQVYRERMSAPGGGLSFTASPVAADGKIYCTAEDGRVLVVQAGPKFKLLETNPLNESVLATPAISEGMMFFRTQGHVVAVKNE